MSSKTDTTTQVIQFFHMIQTQFGKTIKCMRSDSGTEFSTIHLHKFLAEKELSFKPVVLTPLNKIE